MSERLRQSRREQGRGKESRGERESAVFSRARTTPIPTMTTIQAQHARELSPLSTEVEEWNFYCVCSKGPTCAKKSKTTTFVNACIMSLEEAEDVKYKIIPIHDSDSVMTSNNQHHKPSSLSFELLEISRSYEVSRMILNKLSEWLAELKQQKSVEWDVFRNKMNSYADTVSIRLSASSEARNHTGKFDNGLLLPRLDEWHNNIAQGILSSEMRTTTDNNTKDSYLWLNPKHM